MSEADAVEPTPLSRLLAGMTVDGDSSRVDIPADWLQGRAIYGGLTAALCLQATFDHHGDALPPLRSAQLSFIGPAGPSVRMRPTIVRQGKSTAFITVDVFNGEDLAARATLCFGRSRDSAIEHGRLAMPSAPAPDACEPFFEQAARLTPNFTQHFASRFVDGALPCSGAEDPRFLVWLGHRDAGQVHPTVALAALADALPPAAMASFNAPAPISSMTWLFDLLTDRPASDDGWWLSESVAQHSRDGYSAQAMTIWNAAGEPVLVGRQNVAIFA